METISKMRRVPITDQVDVRLRDARHLSWMGDDRNAAEVADRLHPERRLDLLPFGARGLHLLERADGLIEIRPEDRRRECQHANDGRPEAVQRRAHRAKEPRHVERRHAVWHVIRRPHPGRHLDRRPTLTVVLDGMRDDAVLLLVEVAEVHEVESSLDQVRLDARDAHPELVADEDAPGGSGVRCPPADAMASVVEVREDLMVQLSHRWEHDADGVGKGLRGWSAFRVGLLKPLFICSSHSPSRYVVGPNNAPTCAGYLPSDDKNWMRLSDGTEARKTTRCGPAHPQRHPSARRSPP